MAKGKKHYSGKELIRRRQIERQQAEQQQGNRLTKTLKQVNQLRPVIERAKKMAAFLIETAKALLTFIAVCVGLGVLYLVFVVVREVGWIVKQENRRKYEQEGKENGNGSI